MNAKQAANLNDLLRSLLDTGPNDESLLIVRKMPKNGIQVRRLDFNKGGIVPTNREVVFLHNDEMKKQ